LVISTVGLLQVTLSYLSFRFRRVRPILNGEPVVLIDNGKLIERNLKRERLTVDDVAEEARLSSISSFEQVRWAVLETSGRISFIKNEQTAAG
jgi:uncharacterized membrane protein YcaP (DUF421 family)